mgnify:CR=1 FL=1
MEGLWEKSETMVVTASRAYWRTEESRSDGRGFATRQRPVETESLIEDEGPGPSERYRIPDRSRLFGPVP